MPAGIMSRRFRNVHHHRLYGLFIVKRFSERRSLFLAFLIGFFVRSGIPFLRPDPQYCKSRRAQELSRLAVATNLSTCSALARPYLDSSEHDGTLDAVGMTIRGGARFRLRGSIAPHPCMRWIQGIRTMMQIYASAARLRSSGAQSFDRHESHAMVRATATSDRAWRIVA